MAVNITSPVTGGAQTNLTSPTYTVASDQTLPNVKQVVVTALGGTQAGVTTHSVSAPFMAQVEKPLQYRSLGKPNPVTGVIGTVPNNVHKVRTKKGVLPLAGQPYRNVNIETAIAVPAGADTADVANVRAAISLHIGLLNQISAGLGDSVIQGYL